MMELIQYLANLGLPIVYNSTGVSGDCSGDCLKALDPTILQMTVSEHDTSVHHLGLIQQNGW